MYSLLDDFAVLALATLILVLKASAVRVLLTLPRRGLASLGDSVRSRTVVGIDCMTMLAQSSTEHGPRREESDSVTSALSALLHVWVRSGRGRTAISIDALCVIRAAFASREGWGLRAASRCLKVAAKTSQVDRQDLRDFAEFLEQQADELDLVDRAFYLRCWVPSPLRRVRESSVSSARISMAALSSSITAFGLLHLSGEPSLLVGMIITIGGLLFASRSFDGRNRLNVSRGLTRSLRTIAFGQLLIIFSEIVDAVQHLRVGTLLVVPVVIYLGWITFEFSEWSKRPTAGTARLQQLIGELRIGLGFLAAAGVVWSATSLGDGILNNIVVVAPTISLASLNVALGDVELRKVTEPEPE